VRLYSCKWLTYAAYWYSAAQKPGICRMWTSWSRFRLFSDQADCPWQTGSVHLSLWSL